MDHLDLHHIFELGFLLVMIAAGITAIAKKCRQPYPIALVIVGTIIGLVHIPLLEPLKDFITEDSSMSVWRKQKSRQFAGFWFLDSISQWNLLHSTHENELYQMIIDPSFYQ